MEEQLISFETAKLAKEKGFEKLCNFSYDEDEIITANCEQAYNFVAPTQSLLQKWLREKHNFHICIWFNSLTGKYRIDSPIDELDILFEKLNEFKTYEEALEYGLFEILKLI